MVDSSYNKSLAAVFRPSILLEIAQKGSSDYLTYVLKESGLSKQIPAGSRYDHIFEAIYSYLFNSYRSEYVYKNALLNKILLGRYSFSTTAMLTEISAGDSKADVVMANGTSIAYEIKTELDNLDRLSTQLNDYIKVFDRVFVLTHESHAKKIRDIIHQRVGILYLTNRYTINKAREAMANRDSIAPQAAFNILRKSEYLSIIKRRFGFVPEVPNTQIYQHCMALFNKIDPADAHDDMVRALKQRRLSALQRDFITKLPHSLRFVGLMKTLNGAQIGRVQAALCNCYG